MYMPVPGGGDAPPPGERRFGENILNSSLRGAFDAGRAGDAPRPAFGEETIEANVGKPPLMPAVPMPGGETGYRPGETPLPPGEAECCERAPPASAAASRLLIGLDAFILSIGPCHGGRSPSGESERLRALAPRPVDMGEPLALANLRRSSSM